MRSLSFVVSALFATGCFLSSPFDGAGELDGSPPDSGALAEAGVRDAGPLDDGGPLEDGGPPPLDAGRDAQVIEGEDAGVPAEDAGIPAEDAGVPAEDAGVPDACVPSGPEVCDAPGVDEDCDGMSNEGCDCINGATRGCAPPPGSGCEGVETCDQGAYGPCVASSFVAECNGTDDDCDATIDEGSSCGAATGCTFLVGTAAAAGSSYLACPGPLNFEAARAHCQLFGYELTTIETSQENSWLDGALTGNQRWWIGLRANQWVSGSTSTWRQTGAPNNSECAVLDDGANDWGGDNCTSVPHPFVCEAPIP